jgi:GT2 family glycosyltransferase
VIPEITYICPIIHDKYISRLLYTLYKYSDPDSFKFVLIDQCKDRVSDDVWKYIKNKIHLYVHPKRNLGYAKAGNEGILHGLHWKSPYICITNDDIEIMDRRWLQGIWETFEMDKRIIGVVPMSPRVAGWGYGLNYNPEVLSYKEEYSKEDYNFLLEGDFSKVDQPAHMPKNLKGSVVDGAAFIMIYFKREAFEKVGLMDEHFFPGSGEDYDYLARAYSRSYRIVSTSKSWVWHHWTKSKDLFASGTLEDPYYKPKDHPYWNNMGDLYPPEWNEGNEFDIWGRYKNKKGKKVPLKRVKEIFVDQI